MGITFWVTKVQPWYKVEPWFGVDDEKLTFRSVLFF
jgi:hypothetical protein